MFVWVVFACLLGVAFGSFSGLVPGIHVNTIALFALSLFYSYSFDPLVLSVFVLSMGITHSFVDFIPSIFLGAPDSATALSIQPGHRMLLKGHGYMALVLSVVGGLFGVVVVGVLFPFVSFFVPAVYSFVSRYIAYILIAVFGYMIYIEDNWFGAVLVVVLSSLYGFLVLDSVVIDSDLRLFVMLSALFGLSTLFLSFGTCGKVPRQKMKFGFRFFECFVGSFYGFLGGLVAGVLPGLGSSQSAILVQRVFRVSGQRMFIVALGCINTVAIIFSVLSLYLIGRARSGSAIVIEEIVGDIVIDDVFLFLGVAFFVTGIASLVSLKLGKFFCAYVDKIDYQKLVFSVIVFLFLIVLVYVGFYGVFVSLVGVAVGVLPSFFGVKKSLLLACLVVPTIGYFL